MKYFIIELTSHGTVIKECTINEESSLDRSTSETDIFVNVQGGVQRIKKLEVYTSEQLIDFIQNQK